MGKGKSGTINILPQNLKLLKYLYLKLMIQSLLGSFLSPVLDSCCVYFSHTFLPCFPLGEYHFQLPYSNGVNKCGSPDSSPPYLSQRLCTVSDQIQNNAIVSWESESERTGERMEISRRILERSLFVFFQALFYTNFFNP